jgi:hypothetical protein
MGGPWRSREFDAVRWHPPAPHVNPEAEGPSDNFLGIVITYVVSVAALSGIMLGVVLKFGYGW